MKRDWVKSMARPAPPSTATVKARKVIWTVMTSASSSILQSDSRVETTLPGLGRM